MRQASGGQVAIAPGESPKESRSSALENRDLCSSGLPSAVFVRQAVASMRSQIKLGRIGGILIGLHYSWFIIALLIMFSLADHFRHVTPAWSPEVGVDGRSDDRIAVLCYSLAAR